jgi:transcriptional regulator with XRE-family HTH domain
LAQRARVSAATIADLELGVRRPYERTLRDLIAAFEAGGIFFIEEQENVHAAGVSLKWGVEPGKLASVRTPGKSQGDDKGGLDALDWDWESAPIEDDEPLPPLDWTDEDRREQIEYWRARPKRWAAFHEVSRQCLLRAMGVERL